MGEAGGGYSYPDSAEDGIGPTLPEGLVSWRTELRRAAYELAPEYRQSTTACCPRQTIPDSCSCLEDCGCACLDCDCANWGEEYEE